MKTLTYSVVLLLFIAISTTACKKGDVGPQGQKGDNGSAGAAGPTGAQGPAGTANVIYSGWVYAKNFRDSSVDNSMMHIADVPAPDLTTNSLSNALVAVYFSFGGNVFPLPHTSDAGGKSSVINFMPRYKKFIISRYTLDNSNSVNLSTTLQYRYVIIPGGVQAATAVAKHIDLLNYDQVRRFYGFGD